MTESDIVIVFEHLFGFPPRACDLAMLDALHPTGATVAELSEFIWDHYLCEPDSPSLDEVIAAVEQMLQ